MEEPLGNWIDDGSGFLHFVPFDQGCPRDVMTLIEPKVKQWSLYETVFLDGREAVLQGGRLLIFYSGVRVVKQNEKYFILYWKAEDSI